MSLFTKLMRVFSKQHSAAEQILRAYDMHRQKLRETFFRLASESGKPRGLVWAECDWLESFALVYDAEEELYTLFQGINVSFEAVEGSDMEDVDAVSMVRDASAVFHCKNGRWGTGGRVLFNMVPETAARVGAAGQTVIKVG